MPVTIKLTDVADVDNPILGDIHLEKGNYVIIGDGSATFSNAVAQAIRYRLNFFLAEWFLDEREGVPWFQSILIKSPDLTAITSLFRQVIEGSPGVVDVPELTLDLDRTTRILTVVFNANLTDGTTLDSAQFAPFIVEIP